MPPVPPTLASSSSPVGAVGPPHFSHSGSGQSGGGTGSNLSPSSSFSSLPPPAVFASGGVEFKQAASHSPPHDNTPLVGPHVASYAPGVSTSTSSMGSGGSTSSGTSSSSSASNSSSVQLDDLCRIAMSWDLNDQLLAARLFLEQTQHGDERLHDELVNKALGILCKLMASHNSTVQTHSIQTIALLSRHGKYHPSMAAHNLIGRLLDQLVTCRDARVLEALLAALTHLAKTHSACTIICERGYASLLPLLDTTYSASVGVQCNTLALIGALASHTSLQDYLINHDILHFLYRLRDSSQQADIKLNACYCLKAMGYSDNDPSPHHLEILNAAISMGFPRGRCEHAIRTVRMNRMAGGGDDMQAVSTYLLDHNNEPPPMQPIAVGGGDIHRSAFDPSHGHSHGTAQQQLQQSQHEDDKRDNSRRQRQQSLHHHQQQQQQYDHRSSEREKAAAIKRVAHERSTDVNSLLELGFNRKEAILSLYYQQSLENAIEWIVKRQEWKKRRTVAGGPGGVNVKQQRDDEDEEADDEERERSASRDSGFDSDGLYISEFDDDSDAVAGSSDRKRSDEDWELLPSPQRADLYSPVQPPPTHMQRTSSVPQPSFAQSSSRIQHAVNAGSDSPLPSIPPHNRSQTSLPASISSSNVSRYHTLPVPLSVSAPDSPLSPRDDDRTAMADWLAVHNFTELTSKFSEQQISLSTLPLLTDGDLKDLGINKMGDRKRFMFAAKEWLEREREDRTQRGRERDRREPHTRTTHSQPVSPSPSPSQRTGDDNDADSRDGASGSGGRTASPLPAPIQPHASSSLSSSSSSSTDDSGDGSADAGADESHLPDLSLPLSSSRPSGGHKGFVHFAFLQSMPLRHSEVPGTSKKLDLSKETAELQMALNESGKCFRCVWEIATKDNLLKMMAYSRALHISGHGDPNALVLEDGKGDLAPLPVDKLQKILSVGGTQLRFVFVSACFSSRAAFAFAVAGVPHVIAVQEDTQISDTSARAFAHHVYLALCQGLTVREAFLKGQAAVIAANSYNPPCCCAHLHTAPHCSTCEVCRTPVCCNTHIAPCHGAQHKSCCQPTLPHDESLKFLLLPDKGDHDVPLFSDADVPDGQWINRTPQKPPNNLPSGPDDFMGRAKDALAIVPQLLRHRLFLVTGSRGIGKSALARSVATYINDRRHFYACYLIRLHDASTTTAIDVAIAKVLRLQYDAAHLERVHDLVVQHLKYVKTDNKPFLFVFDDCDMLVGDEGRIEAEEKDAQSQQQQPQSPSPTAVPASSSYPAPHSSNSAHTRRAFRQYIASFLDDTPSHILITADVSPGSIDGHTLRVHSLSGLHALDLVALFVNRLPRDIKPDDLRLHLKKVTNLNDLMQHPIFALMHGLPRMAEWCAELLNYTNMDQLYSMLNRQPVLNADRKRVVNNPHWPHQLPDEAKLLLRRCQALMLNKALTVDRKKGRQSQDQQIATASLAGGGGVAANNTADSNTDAAYSTNSTSGGNDSFAQPFDGAVNSSVETTASGSSSSTTSTGSSTVMTARGRMGNSELLWLPVLDSTLQSRSSPSDGAGVSGPLLPLPPSVTPTVAPLSYPIPSPSSPPLPLLPYHSDDAVSSPSASSSGSFSSVLPPLPPLLPAVGYTLPLSSSSISPPLSASHSVSASSSSSFSSAPSTPSLSSLSRRSSSSSFTPLTATSVSFARREPSPPANAP